MKYIYLLLLTVMLRAWWDASAYRHPLYTWVAPVKGSGIVIGTDKESLMVRMDNGKVYEIFHSLVTQTKWVEVKEQ